MQRLIGYGFATYESLIQKLTGASTPEAIVELYQQHKDLFKHEHVVLCLRMLGRFSRQINQENNLQELTSKVNDIVGQLSEYDVVDVLFWVRKFRTNKLSTNLTTESQQQLYAKIQQMAESQMFTFRNMVNIYYDLALLNQQNDFLAKSISEQILTSKQVSPFIILQLFSAQVAKINACNISKADTDVITNTMKILEATLEDFDVDQKSQLFKSLAEVQFQNISPRFQVPVQVKRIKDQLLEKVEILQEEAVLNIFRAYQVLPRGFEINLLRELVDMILTTIEQNPSNLSSKFLVYLIERINNMSQQRIQNELIKKIVIELNKRIQNKEIENYLIPQLCENLQSYQRNDELIETLKINTQFSNNFKVLNFLYNCNVNLKENILRFIQQQNEKQYQINLHSAVNYLNYAQRDAKDQVQVFVEIIKQSIEKNPLNVLRLFSEININSQIKNQLQEEAYFGVIQSVKDKKVEVIKVLKELITTCGNNKCRQSLLELYEENKQQMGPKIIISKLIQDFNSFDSDTLTITLYLLQKDLQNVPLGKFIDLLTLNQHKLVGLIKSDQIQWVTKVIGDIFIAKENSKIFPIVNFINRFENAGYQSKFVSQLLKKIVEHIKKTNPDTIHNEQSFVQLLLSHQIFNPEDAVLQLKNEKLNHLTKAQLVSVAFKQENVPEEIKQLAETLKNYHFTQLNEDITKFQSLLCIVTIGNFKDGELEDIRLKLKSAIAKCSSKQYYDLVINCRDLVILKDLAGYFQQKGVKLGFSRMLKVVGKFQRFQLGSQMLYNILLESLGNSFNSIYNEQRVEVLGIFAEGKIKQTDVFKKNLEKIAKNSQSYRNYHQDILDAVIQVGFIEEEILDIIKQIFNERPQITEQAAYKLLQYYLIADQPLDVLEKINLTQVRTKEYQKTFYVYSILKKKYPQSKLLEAFSTIIQEPQFNKARDLINIRVQKSYPFELTVSYLKSLGVKVEVNQIVNDLLVPIYLPDQKTALTVIQGSSLNFDKATLNGQALLNQQLMNLTFEKHLSFNFKEFNAITNNEDRAKFLINLGIKSNVDPKTADYTQIPKNEQRNHSRHNSRQEQRSEEKIQEQ